MAVAGLLCGQSVYWVGFSGGPPPRSSSSDSWPRNSEMHRAPNASLVRVGVRGSDQLAVPSQDRVRRDDRCELVVLLAPNAKLRHAIPATTTPPP